MLLVAHDALPIQAGVQALSVAESLIRDGRPMDQCSAFRATESAQKRTGSAPVDNS